MRKATVNYKNLYKRYLQMRSALEVLKVMLYDYGITYSPTVVRRFELSQYLVRELKLLGFTDYIDKRKGVSLVTEVSYLEYVQKAVHHKHTFQVGLNLIISYLQYKKEVSYLEEQFGFNSVKNAGGVTLKPQVRAVKLSDSKLKGDFPVWLPKTLNEEVSVHDGYAEVEESLVSVYYTYIGRLAKEQGISLPVNWTFLKGLKRKQEDSLLPLIFKGSVEVTNERVRPLLETLFDKKGQFQHKLFFEFLAKKQEEVISKTLKKDPKLQVWQITPYKVLFTRGSNPTYPLYFNYICWDSDNHVPLAESNLFAGLGGEFTRVSEEGLTPYYLKNNEGKTELFYKLESKSRLHSKNTHLTEYLEELVQSFGDNFGADGLLISLTPSRRTLLKHSLERLEKKGVRIIDTDC